MTNNWKKTVSVSLAASATAGLVALAHALPPSVESIVTPLVGALAAAVAHWLDVWGNT